MTELADAVRRVDLRGVAGVHCPLDNKAKDRVIGQNGQITVSTVASAKGYDAYCVLLVSANGFVPDVKGRATFYVGCTRAIEYLEVFAYEKKDLALEMEAASAPR